jgi:hypothetical protein
MSEENIEQTNSGASERDGTAVRGDRASAPRGERNAADTVCPAQAAQVQAEVDARDVGYVERIQKREALRRS